MTYEGWGKAVHQAFARLCYFQQKAVDIENHHWIIPTKICLKRSVQTCRRDYLPTGQSKKSPENVGNIFRTQEKYECLSLYIFGYAMDMNYTWTHADRKPEWVYNWFVNWKSNWNYATSTSIVLAREASWRLNLELSKMTTLQCEQSVLGALLSCSRGSCGVEYLMTVWCYFPSNILVCPGFKRGGVILTIA